MYEDDVNVEGRTGEWSGPVVREEFALLEDVASGLLGVVTEDMIYVGIESGTQDRECPVARVRAMFIDKRCVV